jgi:hypothetical protein
MTQTRLPGRIAREIMRVACQGSGIIDADMIHPTQILAERGYIIITALPDDCYEIEPTELAKQRGATKPKGWRRYPPLLRTKTVTA